MVKPKTKKIKRKQFNIDNNEKLYLLYLKWCKNSNNEKVYNAMKEEIIKVVGKEPLDHCAVIVALANKKIASKKK